MENCEYLSSCKNQRANLGRLHQQQSSSQHPVRRSATPSWEETNLQTRLLTGISLLANGRPKVNRNASFQLRKQDVRLQTTVTRTEQSIIGILKFHEGAFRQNDHSRPMCANVDDIGIAANSVAQLIRNIRAVFECISQAGLKLTTEKCHFGVTEVEFLGSNITLEGNFASPPRTTKFKNF